MSPSSVHRMFCFILSIIQIAFAADSKPMEPCTAHLSTTGSFHDLRQLMLTPINYSKPLKAQISSATNESYHARGYDYPYNFTLNFCGPVVEARNLTSVVGLSKKLIANVSAYYMDKESKETYSIGLINDEPIFRGRKLMLNFTGGSPCPDLDSDGNPIIEKRNLFENEDHVVKRRPATRRKSTLLSFTCDTAPALTNRPAISFLGTTDHCTYVFDVRSRWACASAPSTQVSGTLGPGSVFGLILGIAIAVYLVGGVVYQRNVMHQRGWRQLPNYNVWAGIFGFFSDMFVILFSSCTRCMPSMGRLFGGKRGGYHRVGDQHRPNGPNGVITRGRTQEDENRLIDQLDETWD